MMNNALSSAQPLPLDAMIWVETVALLQRAVLGLYLNRDYTCSESARLLGLSSGTVANLLAAGIRDLAPQPAHGPVTTWE